MSAASRSKKGLPLIAIVGRPNVGKSTLFNRIIGKQRAIIHSIEGITRDRFIEEANWNGRRFCVVDTGGIVENPLDEITRKMQQQVQQAIQDAHVVIFVVDGQQEITRADHVVCQFLLRCGKPVVLAINKLDNPRLALNQYEYYQLGLGEPHPISAGHNSGIEDLLNAVFHQLPMHPCTEGEETVSADSDQETSQTHPIKVAVIGRPNVGKSSFINAVLNEERTIVSDIPGTTRDAIDVEFFWKGKEYLLIDTAGLRRKAGIRAPVEHFSVARALRAIRRADVCLVMMEATEGIAEQDKRIIGYILEQGTGLILVWTKWDLITDKEKRFKDLENEIDLKMPHITFAPRVTISTVTRKRVFSLFEYINRVDQESVKRVPTADLNRFLEHIKAKHTPPSQKGKHAKILYATQSGTKPTEFVLFVNQTRLFHFSYLRFIENQLREAFGFEGIPIKLHLREERSRP